MSILPTDALTVGWGLGRLWIMSKTKSPTISRGQLLDVTSDVAWRFSAYTSYGGNEANAIRAIQKNAPASRHASM